jgi:hypothetical protein
MRFVITVIFTLSLFKGTAQDRLILGLQYNYQHLSDYAVLYTEYKAKKHSFKLGARYQLQYQLPKTGVLFHRGGYGARFSERLGMEYSYHYELWDFKDRFELVLGYLGTYIHTGYRLVLSPNDIEYFDPIDVLSHHLTTKGSYHLVDGGTVWVQFGLGVTTYFNVYKGFAIPPRTTVFGQERDLSVMFAVGGGYPLWRQQQAR